MPEKASYQPANIGALKEGFDKIFEKNVTQLMLERVGSFDGQKFEKESDIQNYENTQEFVHKTIGLTSSLKSIRLALEIQREQNQHKDEPLDDISFEKAINTVDRYIYLLQARTYNIIGDVPDQIHDETEERLKNMDILEPGDPIYRTSTNTFETPQTAFADLDLDPPAEPTGATILANLQYKKESKKQLNADIFLLWQHKLKKMRDDITGDNSVNIDEVQSYRDARKYAEAIIQKSQTEQPKNTIGSKAYTKELTKTAQEIHKSEEYERLAKHFFPQDLTQQKLFQTITKTCLNEKDLIATMAVEILGEDTRNIDDFIENMTQFGSEYLTCLPSIYDHLLPGGPYQLTEYQLGTRGDLSALPTELKEKLHLPDLSNDPSLPLAGHHTTAILSKTVKIATLIRQLEEDHHAKNRITLHPDRKEKLHEHLQTEKGIQGMKCMIGYIHHNPEETKWIIKRWIDDNFSGSPASYIDDIPDDFLSQKHEPKERKKQIRRYIMTISNMKGISFLSQTKTKEQHRFTETMSEQDAFAILGVQSMNELEYKAPDTDTWKDATRLDPRNFHMPGGFRMGWTFRRKRNTGIEVTPTKTPEPKELPIQKKIKETETLPPKNTEPFVIQKGQTPRDIYAHFTEKGYKVDTLSDLKFRMKSSQEFIPADDVPDRFIQPGWQFIPKGSEPIIETKEAVQEKDSLLDGLPSELQTWWKTNKIETLTHGDNREKLYEVLAFFQNKREQILQTSTTNTTYQKLCKVVDQRWPEYRDKMSPEAVKKDTTGYQQILANILGMLRDRHMTENKITTAEQVDTYKEVWKKAGIRIISTHAIRENKTNGSLAQGWEKMKNNDFDYTKDDQKTEKPEHTSMLGFRKEAFDACTKLIEDFRKESNQTFSEKKQKENPDAWIYINGIAEDIGHHLGGTSSIGESKQYVSGYDRPAHINGLKLDLPLIRHEGKDGTLSDMYGQNAAFFTYLTGKTKIPKGSKYKQTITKNGIKMTIRYGDDGAHGTHMDIFFHI